MTIGINAMKGAVNGNAIGAVDEAINSMAGMSAMYQGYESQSGQF